MPFFTNDWFDLTWGDLTLYAELVSTDNGRDRITHHPAQGDFHPTSDRGAKQRITRCKLLFDDMDGESDAPSVMFKRLKNMVDRGVEAILVHPVDGAFMAGVEEFTYDLTPGAVIKEASITFVPTDDPAPVTPLGTGVAGVAGTQAVSSSADTAAAELDKAGLISDIPDKARTMAAAWQEPDPDSHLLATARQILNDISSMSQQIMSYIDEFNLEEDIALFGAWQSLVMLGDALRSAAIAYSSTVPATTKLHVSTRSALLPLMAKIYGGDSALDRAQQVLDLNDIPNPGWLDVGDYIIPVGDGSNGQFVAGSLLSTGF